MKQIQLDSPEFNRVLKNMELEILYLNDSLQQNAVEILNSGVENNTEVDEEGFSELQNPIALKWQNNSHFPSSIFKFKRILVEL